MEDICLRVPHILEQINEILNNQSLVKCKEVSRMMGLIIENQKSGKFLTIRVIQSYIKNSGEFAKDWKIVFQKSPMKKLYEFGILVQNFYKAVPRRLEGSWSPMHIAAERGRLDFCKFIAKASTTKSYEWSPLYFSAQGGHLEVSEFIYEEFEEKIGRVTNDISAQHLAAKNGHLETYKFLHVKLNNINPASQEFITPLHLAAQYGHFDVCKYICDNTHLVGPTRSDGNTPLTIAFHRGHVKIARLLNERDNNAIRRKTLRELKCFLFFMKIVTVFDLFVRYPFFATIFGVSIGLFPYPLRYIFMISIPFAVNVIKIIINVLKDIWFCLWTGPKFEY